MAQIKKNVNFLLILLFLAAIAALIGFTTYYNTQYRSLSGEYNERVSELAQTQENLSNQRENLLSTRTELELRVADKDKFENLYSEVVAEKNKLDKDLAITRGALASTQSQLQEALTNLQQSENELATALRDLEEEKTLAAAYLQQRNNYCNQLKNLNASVSC